MAPLAARGTIGLSAKGELGKISKCEEGGCTEVSIEAGVTIAVGSIAEIGGSLKYGKDANNESSCEYDLLSLKIEAEATGHFSGRFKGNLFLGEDSPDTRADFFASKVSLLARGKVSATVFDIYDVEGNIKE